MVARTEPYRAVLRIAKVKAGSLDRLSRHDTRAQPVENDDPGRGGVVWLTDATDPASAVRQAIAGLDKPPRANAVLATQAVITANHEWFGEGAERRAKAEAFTEAAMAWARANMPGQIVAACRHDGEAAPHLHIWSVPIVETAIAVNRRRPELGKRPCRRLDYNGLYGNTRESAQRLRGLQTSIGAALAPLGLARGKPKEQTNATHKTTRQWKAEQLAALRRAKAWEAATKAVAVGEIVGLEGPPTDRLPAFAPTVAADRREALAKAIEPDRGPILAWIAEWAERLRKAAEERITRIAGIAVQEAVRLVKVAEQASGRGRHTPSLPSRQPRPAQRQRERD